MSASLARESQPERAQQSGPARLISLVAGAAFPVDRVLAGMVAVGLGMEAICLYLGLSPGVLQDSLIHLGLATPHDRPLRKSGARGWSVLDIMRLIAWRVAGIHPETIAARLSTPKLPRSANAVRAKARRLGLKPPARKMLRRVDPSTLVDPIPGFGFHSPPTSAPSHPFDSKTARCGTAFGSVRTRSECSSAPPVHAGSESHDPSSRDIVFPPPSDSPANQAERDPIAPAGYRRVGATPDSAVQRDPQQARIIQTPATSSHPTGGSAERPGDVRPAATTMPSKSSAALAPPLPIDLSRGFAPDQDLTWVGKSERVAFNEQLVRLVSLRAFGGEHWKLTAKLLGFTEPALRTLRTRIDLPTDISCSRKGGEYDHERALSVLAKSGWELYKDIDAGGRWFWRRKGSGQRRSLYTQRLRGLIDKDEARRFRPRISLADSHCPA